MYGRPTSLTRQRVISIETPIIHIQPTDSAMLQTRYCRQAGLSSLHHQSLEQSPSWGRCSVGQVGHGPPKILVGWATMHLAPPIIGLYVR